MDQMIYVSAIENIARLRGYIDVEAQWKTDSKYPGIFLTFTHSSKVKSSVVWLAGNELCQSHVDYVRKNLPDTKAKVWNRQTNRYETVPATLEIAAQCRYPVNECPSVPREKREKLAGGTFRQHGEYCNCAGVGIGAEGFHVVRCLKLGATAHRRPVFSRDACYVVDLLCAVFVHIAEGRFHLARGFKNWAVGHQWLNDGTSANTAASKPTNWHDLPRLMLADQCSRGGYSDCASKELCVDFVWAEQSRLAKLAERIDRDLCSVGKLGAKR